MNLLLIVLAVLPAVVLALFILYHDRYEKEPFRLLVKVFFFGMLATIPTIAAESLGSAFNMFRGTFGIAVEAFIIVGFSEEFFKRMVVRKIAYNNPAFDEKMDGIVYCSFAALGFATLENIFYVISYYAIDPNIWITRAVLSVPAHMLLGITMGYFISLAKFCNDKQLSKQYMRKALIVPAVLHGIFDFILLSQIPLLLLIFIPFVIYLWISSYKKLRKYYKESKRWNA